MFFWVSLALYILINVDFALLYMIVPGQVAGTHPHAFWESFFSIPTLSTAGRPGRACHRVVRIAGGNDPERSGHRPCLRAVFPLQSAGDLQ
ncbi:hypothetical protein [Gluconacetobacter tumulisoli]|uniref:hypothetical protein n=1 Tax=Gluconacetobacter tumulisoli TaxID=1286189 RepID=UPI001FE4CAC2|nr:hypothetical protein [Gluconacetobacter tumulisoli]